MERRNFLRNSAIGVGVIATATPTFTFGAKSTFNKEYKKITGGKKSKTSSKLKIKAPEIAENGKVVPVTVQVSGVDATEVESISILSTKNSQGRVATAIFSKHSKEAYLQTRMKLAGTQEIVALAVMKNGDIYEARKTTKVTIGGCG